jgi:3-dehydroquinate dehydratase I
MGSVVVRSLKIGEGIPKICVPIVGSEKKDIISKAIEIKTKPVDIVEWRVDYFEGAKDFGQIKNVLLELRGILSHIPILFTFRTKKEGGEKDISPIFYVKMLEEIILTENIDLIDVEFFMGEEVVSKLVACAHKTNIKVIMSNHDFDKTPSKEKIINRLIKMIEWKADIPKIAVMPNSTGDVLVLLEATNEMKSREPSCPIITMSMGKKGLISRFSGEIFGSAVSFAAVGKVSAPGQIEIDDLFKILHQMHKAN